MPVNGLPQTLEMLMSSLCRDNSMKSWQIYEEQSGDITLKVRFEGDFGTAMELVNRNTQAMPAINASQVIAWLETVTEQWLLERESPRTKTSDTQQHSV